MKDLCISEEGNACNSFFSFCNFVQVEERKLIVLFLCQ